MFVAVILLKITIYGNKFNIINLLSKTFHLSINLM